MPKEYPSESPNTPSQENSRQESFHTLDIGPEIYINMSPRTFARYIKRVINSMPPAEKEHIRSAEDVLFPELNETHPLIRSLQKYLEYIYVSLGETPLDQWETKTIALVKEFETLSVPQEIKDFLKHIIGLVTPFITSAEAQQQLKEIEKEKENGYFHMFQFIKHMGNYTTEITPTQKIIMEHHSLEKLLQHIPGTSIIDTSEGREFLVSTYWDTTPHHFRVPLMHDVFYKGGVPRILGKMLILQEMTPGTPQYDLVMTSLKAEFPLNDLDLCLGPDADTTEVQRRTGEEDITGYEWFYHGFSPERFLSNRDCSCNSMVFGPEGLYISTLGKESIRTGINTAMKADQGIFGHDALIKGDLTYGTSRTIERTLKFLIEGKCTAARFLKGDLKIHMGTFLLGSAIRWFGKDKKEHIPGERSAHYLQRLGILLKKMGHYDRYKDLLTTYTYANPEIADFPDILRFLDMYHAQFPFVERSRNPEMRAKTLWILKRLFLRVVHDFKITCKLPSNTDLFPETDDKEAVTFNLSQGMPSPYDIAQTEEAIRQALPSFYRRWDERQHSYQTSSTLFSAEYMKARACASFEDLSQNSCE